MLEDDDHVAERSEDKGPGDLATQEWIGIVVKLRGFVFEQKGKTRLDATFTRRDAKETRHYGSRKRTRGDNEERALCGREGSSGFQV